MTRESLRSQIANKCIYFSGILNETCKAGVPYLSGLVLPCFRKATGAEPPCTRREWPSEEYIAAHLSEIDASEARMRQVAEVVERAALAHGRDEDWECDEVCPVCGKKLHLTFAAHNSHFWGRCETEGCLSWIE